MATPATTARGIGALASGESRDPTTSAPRAQLVFAAIESLEALGDHGQRVLVDPRQSVGEDLGQLGQVEILGELPSVGRGGRWARGVPILVNPVESWSRMALG